MKETMHKNRLFKIPNWSNGAKIKLVVPGQPRTGAQRSLGGTGVGAGSQNGDDSTSILYSLPSLSLCKEPGHFNPSQVKVL